MPRIRLKPYFKVGDALRCVDANDFCQHLVDKEVYVVKDIHIAGNGEHFVMLTDFPNEIFSEEHFDLLDETQSSAPAPSGRVRFSDQPVPSTRIRF